VGYRATIVPIVALAFITGLNILAVGTSFRTHLNLHRHQENASSPARLPLLVRPAALIVEATERYGLEADAEWASLMPRNHGFGFVRLGPQGRPFEPSIYHQLHCLSELRRTFVYYSGNMTARRLWHTEHCLNYLRQAILCNSDMTLEPSYTYIFEDNSTTSASSGMGVVHSCVDWTQVRNFVEENQIQYIGVPLKLR
ncbi:hypothetical protein DFH07DRAFT_1027692, partial [Mycena maculata]